MNTTLSILFRTIRAKATTDGLHPVYLRITINGIRWEVSTRRYVDPLQWSTTAGRIKPGIKTEDARILNGYLDSQKSRVYEIQRQIVQERLDFNIQNFKIKWLGVSNRPRMICEVFQHHNDQFKVLCETGARALATWERWDTALTHTKNFIQWKYKKKDVDLKDIKYEFISDFEFYLKTYRRQQHNTAIKYLEQLKSVINICLKNDWLGKDPFIGFKFSKKEVKKEFLSEAELQTIQNKVFLSHRMSQVKDIFIFCCYTGLAYVDIKKLKPENISLGIDGEKWIFTSRQKTDSTSNVPLLQPALEILEKYKDDPRCINKGVLFPVFSNQKMNSYLKEIADVCDIQKNITFHMARHTFATTVTLSNNVPIETVSKMLGHSTLKQTQHYAKILDKKVSNDMKFLKQKFNSTLNKTSTGT